MRTFLITALTFLILGSGWALLVARGQQPGNSQADRPAATTAGAAHHAPVGETTTTTVADVPIPNLPGKRLVSRVIEYPPGAGLPSHRHAPSAFIYAHVLSGEIRSKVDDQPVRVYRPGETWFEKPGVHHQVSTNASNTEPARLLAVLIVDVGDEQLTIPDAP